MLLSVQLTSKCWPFRKPFRKPAVVKLTMMFHSDFDASKRKVTLQAFIICYLAVLFAHLLLERFAILHAVIKLDMGDTKAGIFYFAKDDSIVSDHFSKVSCPNDDPAIGDVCVLKFSNKSWQGIVVEKRDGARAKYELDILLLDNAERAKYTDIGRELGVKLKHTFPAKLASALKKYRDKQTAPSRNSLDADSLESEVDSEDTTPTTPIVSGPPSSSVNQNTCETRFDYLYGKRKEAEKEFQDHISAYDKFCSSKNVKDAAQDDEIKRIKTLEDTVSGLVASVHNLKQMVCHLQGKMTSAPLPASDQTAEERIKCDADLCRRKGITKWTNVCTELLAKYFSQEELATSCPRGGDSTKRPSLDKAKLEHIEAVIGEFAQSRKPKFPSNRR